MAHLTARKDEHIIQQLKVAHDTNKVHKTMYTNVAIVDGELTLNPMNLIELFMDDEHDEVFGRAVKAHEAQAKVLQDFLNNLVDSGVKPRALREWLVNGHSLVEFVNPGGWQRSKQVALSVLPGVDAYTCAPIKERIQYDTRDYLAMVGHNRVAKCHRILVALSEKEGLFKVYANVAVFFHEVGNGWGGYRYEIAHATSEPLTLCESI